MRAFSIKFKIFNISLLFLLSCKSDIYYVKKVIDGDTFVLYNNLRVRLLGIDAPERGDPFWNVAKRELEKMILGRKVLLEYDVQKFDKYRRVLAYVFVNEKFVNEELVKRGYAWVYIIPPNLKYSERLIKAQEEAKKFKRGIWGNPYYIASKRSKKFHIFYCPSAKKISPKNKIVFLSKEEALKKGYKPAQDCNP